MSSSNPASVSADPGSLSGFAQAACLAVGALIYIVWLVRWLQKGEYAVGKPRNIFYEFENYGLGASMVYAVGFFESLLATGLFTAVFVPSLSWLAFYAALGEWFLMVGATFKHIRTRDDPLSRAKPAFGLIFVCACISASDCPDYIDANIFLMVTGVVFVGLVVAAFRKNPSQELTPHEDPLLK